MATVAFINEYGSSDGRVPERSFMRATVSEQKEKIKKFIRQMLTEVNQGRRSKEEALGLLGEFVADLMRLQIDATTSPPNALSTILAKSGKKNKKKVMAKAAAGLIGQDTGNKAYAGVKDHPLIATGQMKRSITYEVNK